MNKSIDEIVNTFINDLKKTKEYKEAWRNCNETKDIVFDFPTRKFIDIITYKINNDPMPLSITMDEEILLGR